MKGRLRAGLAQSRARGHPGGPSAGRLWLLGKAEGQRRVQGHKASCHGAVTRVPWAKQLLSQAKVRGMENLPWNREPPTRPLLPGAAESSEDGAPSPLTLLPALLEGGRSQPAVAGPPCVPGACRSWVGLGQPWGGLSPGASNRGVSVSWGCRNKGPRTVPSNSRSVFSRGSGGHEPKIKVLAGLFLSGALSGKTCQASLLALVAAGHPWCPVASSCPPISAFSSVSAKSPSPVFYKDTSHWIRAQPKSSMISS